MWLPTWSSDSFLLWFYVCCGFNLFIAAFHVSMFWTMASPSEVLRCSFSQGAFIQMANAQLIIVFLISGLCIRSTPT